MSYRFQRISQCNPCRKVTQVAPSVGVMLFALPVGGDSIWPIGKGILWGEPWVLASCNIMEHTTDWVMYLVCRSFSQTSEKLCMGPGSPELTNAP